MYIQVSEYLRTVKYIFIINDGYYEDEWFLFHYVSFVASIVVSYHKTDTKLSNMCINNEMKLEYWNVLSAF